MTNFEYLHSLDEEQLAHALMEFGVAVHQMTGGRLHTGTMKKIVESEVLRFLKSEVEEDTQMNM